MKKTIKNIVIGVIVMSLLTGLTGCNPDKLKKSAAEELQQKYGEEFTIFSVSRDSLNSVPTDSYTAVCAPASDETMKFTASIWEDGDLLSDTYVHAMNGRQVSEAVEPLAVAIAKSYAIRTRIRQYTVEDENWREAATLKNVLQNVEEARPYVRIIVDVNTLQGLSYAEEYKLIENFYKNELPIKTALDIYFVDAQMLQKCKEYFEKNVELRGDFWDMIANEPSVGLGISEGGILRTSEEEYIEQRTNGKNNADIV